MQAAIFNITTEVSFVDLTEESMILQVVGDPGKIDALVEMIEKFRIIELVRTGKVLLARGAETT